MVYTIIIFNDQSSFVIGYFSKIEPGQSSFVNSSIASSREAAHRIAAPNRGTVKGVDHLPAAVGQQLVRARPALLQDERVVTLLALMDDLGVRRDRAPPCLEPGQARQLVGLQRQEPIQLLDQSARDRCHRFIVPRPRACEPQASNKGRMRRRLLL